MVSAPVWSMNPTHPACQFNSMDERTSVVVVSQTVVWFADQRQGPKLNQVGALG